MANYNYRSQFSYSNAAKRVTLMAQATMAGTGSPSIISGTGMGISSITHTATGKFRVTLSHNFNDLLNVSAVFQSGSSAPTAPAMNIAADAVTTGTFDIQFRDVAGSAADPASGEVMYITIDLNESSLAY